MQKSQVQVDVDPTRYNGPTIPGSSTVATLGEIKLN